MAGSNYGSHNRVQVEEDRAQQTAAGFTDRYGVIDGVKFDFRHKDLDSSNWRPP